MIVDAGGLLSVLASDQDDHEAFLEAVQTHRGPLVVSPLVVAEVDHLVLDRSGREAELAFLNELVRSYRVEPFSNADVERARELCARYADLLTFDLTDASCVVLAERYDSFDILTTDERDFRAVTGRGGRYFRLLPYDAL
ncbi:MAG: PIN domain-containing protein [Actinomycetota bacterium]|nr:PIN domain-containing protein [Actinomycetota bacterium]